MKRHLKKIKGQLLGKYESESCHFLYTTHHYDLFYITVKYHDFIPKGIQVMEQTQNCI